MKENKSTMIKRYERKIKALQKISMKHSRMQATQVGWRLYKPVAWGGSFLSRRHFIAEKTSPVRKGE
jgi:hypothetical protein